MHYCSICTYPINHPLNLTFNKDMQCSGCQIHKEKYNINWSKRLENLKKIVLLYRNKKQNYFDCVIPVSGARDSYFTVYVAKEILKLKPFLVNYNTHYNTEIGFRNLSYLKTLHGLNYLNLTIKPQTIKKITKYTLENFGNIYWHCIAGQTVFPVQIAVKMKIPLIIWGAHQGVDQVGMYSHLDEVEMSRRYRRDHDLFNNEAEILLQKSSLKKEDLHNFIYPADKEIQDVGVKGIYLNNYFQWDSKIQNEKMIKDYSLETLVQNRTFDKYQNIDCLMHSNVHDLFKLRKFGYSIVSDHCSREIRLGRLTRKEAMYLIDYYRFKKPKYENYFCKWANIDKKKLDYFYDKFTNYDIWKKKEKKLELKEDFVSDEVKFDKNKKKKVINILNKLNYLDSSRGKKGTLYKIPKLFSKGFGNE